MKVVLLEDIEDLGLAGDIKEIKDGYARNYLLPRKLVILATRENIKIVEDKRNSILRKTQKRFQEEQSKKAALDGTVVEIKAKAGEQGKLFGSITTNDIYNALKEKGLDVDKKSIKLPSEQIRAVGVYEVTIALYRDIKATIKVVVQALDEN